MGALLCLGGIGMREHPFVDRRERGVSARRQGEVREPQERDERPEPLPGARGTGGVVERRAVELDRRAGRDGKRLEPAVSQTPPEMPPRGPTTSTRSSAATSSSLHWWYSQQASRVFTPLQ